MFTDAIRVLGFWRWLGATLTFPIWFVWYKVYFMPNLRRTVIREMCGGNAALFKEEMLGQYAHRCLLPHTESENKAA